MKSFYLSSIAAIAILVYGCTKETTIREEYNPNISLWGTYKVTNTLNGLEDLRFVTFSTKKIVNSYFMSSAGMKYQHSSSIVAYPDQVIADIFGNGTSSVYNYRFSGDTLIISGGINTYFKAIKSNESEVANWVTMVSKTDEILGVYTNRTSGIGFDGTNILLPNYQESKITKINLSTRLPNGDVDLTNGYPNTVEFDGTDYWIGNNGYNRMYKYSTMGGNYLLASPNRDIGSWVYGIAFDPAGNDIWAYSNGNDTLYQINRTSNAVVSKSRISYIRDLAWSNGKLYMVNGSYIYKISTSTLEIEKTYQLSSADNIYGIAAVGSDFWLNVNGNKLIKVTLN